MKMAAMVCRPTKPSNYLNSKYDYYFMISNFYQFDFTGSGRMEISRFAHADHWIITIIAPTAS
jgi:hypothetical protein